MEEQIYDCCVGILLPFSLQQIDALCMVKLKKGFLRAFIFFWCLQVGLLGFFFGGGRKKPQKKKKKRKTAHKAGKCFEVIVYFIPDLSFLSVIQECQGTSQKTSSDSLWKHSLRRLLQLAAPSRVCFYPHQFLWACWLSRQSAMQLLHNRLLPVPPDSLGFSRHATRCKTGFLIQFSVQGCVVNSK